MRLESAMLVSSVAWVSAGVPLLGASMCVMGLWLVNASLDNACRGAKKCSVDLL